MSGDTVTVSGILKTDMLENKDKKNQGIFTDYLSVNSIVFKPKHSDYVDPRKIDKMKSYSRVFYSLIKSFCPAIYGHELVKMGLLLGIVGGSNKAMTGESVFR